MRTPVAPSSPEAKAGWWSQDEEPIDIPAILQIWTPVRALS
jgi:hypothetical protein